MTVYVMRHKMCTNNGVRFDVRKWKDAQPIAVIRYTLQSTRTVVLIHMSAPTFRPIATAPAVPPRMAEAAALSMISRNVGSVFTSAVALMLAGYLQLIWELSRGVSAMGNVVGGEGRGALQR